MTLYWKWQAHGESQGSPKSLCFVTLEEGTGICTNLKSCSSKSCWTIWGTCAATLVYAAQPVKTHYETITLWSLTILPHFLETISLYFLPKYRMCRFPIHTNQHCLHSEGKTCVWSLQAGPAANSPDTMVRYEERQSAVEEISMCWHTKTYCLPPSSPPFPSLSLSLSLHHLPASYRPLQTVQESFNHVKIDTINIK